MVQITGKPFTQLKNLNVQNTFLINGKPGTLNANELFTGFSVAVTQDPVGLDNPLQVEFGPAKLTSADPVNLLADGTVVINEPGSYVMIVVLNVGRSAAAQTSFMFIRFELNGVQLGTTFVDILENANVIHTLDLSASVNAGIAEIGNLSVGDEIKTFIYRDSAGTNDGGLVSVTSSIGWNTSPTAAISVSKPLVG